jgi:hypothetical protein
MKNRLLVFFSWLTAVGLFLVIAAKTTSAQAQPTPPPLVTVTPNAPAVPSQPPSGFVLKSVGIVKEVEKLTQSGADPAVVKAFVQSWRTPYSISADEILRLHAAGVPSDILTILIQHGAELGAAVPTAANTATSPNAPVSYPGAIPQISQPSSAAPPVPDQYVPQPTYPVEPPVVYSYPTYPAYDYGYYYGYPGPYYYYPGVAIGLGFGFRSHGGFHGGFGGHGGGFGGHGGGGFGGRSGGGGHR